MGGLSQVVEEQAKSPALSDLIFSSFFCFLWRMCSRKDNDEDKEEDEGPQWKKSALKECWGVGVKVTDGSNLTQRQRQRQRQRWRSVGVLDWRDWREKVGDWGANLVPNPPNFPRYISSANAHRTKCHREINKKEYGKVHIGARHIEEACVWRLKLCILDFVRSDRSSYSDSVLGEIRARPNFLRFWAFLPIYLVFLFENWMQIDNNLLWGPWWL